MAANALQALTTKLRKVYGETIADVDKVGYVKKIQLSSPQLNYAFGGGFPLGRISELFGPESGGKTVLSEYIGGEIQQRTDSDARTVLFIDQEYAFDASYAKTAGLDVDKNFIFVRPLDGEEGFTIVEEYIRTGEIGLVIWDSVASTPSRTEMTAEQGKATFGGTAKVFSIGLRKVNPYLSRTSTPMILINQVRAQVGGMPTYGPGENTKVGGWAVPFYSSTRFRVSKMEDILDSKVAIGNRIKIKNVKNKIGMPKRSAELDLYYATGFNPDMEYLDFIIDLGIVKRGGAWLSNEEWGFKGQGRDSLFTFLRSKPELFDIVKKQVNGAFSVATSLDASEEEISAEDQAENEIVENLNEDEV